MYPRKNKYLLDGNSTYLRKALLIFLIYIFIFTYIFASKDCHIKNILISFSLFILYIFIYNMNSGYKNIEKTLKPSENFIY